MSAGLPPLSETALLGVLGGTALAALFALGTVLFRKGRTEDQARAYLAGVHYVLSDNPDGAIAELSKAARLNTQTYETYFALAALLRRKGELAWAIRINQNVLLCNNLTEQVRRRAQLELALDYRRSGLKDEAVAAFETLLKDEPRHREALLRYRQMVEETRDLSRAIELQERLVELDGRGENVLAHLLAEHAQEQLALDPDGALILSHRATVTDARCAHAWRTLAQAQIGRGDKGLAQAALRQALALEPELVPGALALMREVFEPLSDGERFLDGERAQRKAPHAAPYELALALWHRADGKMQLATVELKRLVERSPSYLEARKELGALLLSQDGSDELRADYREMLGTLGRPALAFVCRQCHQRLAQYGFRCTYCGEWDSVQRDHPSAESQPRI